MGRSMHDVDQMPLWLAHPWDAMHDQTKDAATRVERAVQFAEALCEFLAVSYFATLVADRSLADERATRRLAEAAARTFGKLAAFGDWVQFVRDGFGAGAALNRVVCGVPDEPRFAKDSAVAESLKAMGKPPKDATPLLEFLERLVWLRNDKAHGRLRAADSTTLVDDLTLALDEVLRALPNVIRRPLCHVEQAAVAKEGFVVHYRHLLGTGQRRQKRHSQPEPPSPSPWRSDQLVLWDGNSPLPTPVPEFLARFTAATHELRLCQGTPNRDANGTMLFHSWQPTVQSVSTQEATSALWSAIRALEAPPNSGNSAPGGAAAEQVYRGAFHRALTNDGLISADEQAMLDTIANGLGLTAPRRSALEATVVEGWTRAGRPISGPGAEPFSVPPASVPPAAGLPASDTPHLGPAPLPLPPSPVMSPPSTPTPDRGRPRAFGRVLAVAVAVLALGAAAVFGPRLWAGVTSPGGKDRTAHATATATAGMGQSCHHVSDCEGDLDCRDRVCTPFPQGRGGDAARAYKMFATRRNDHDLEGFQALIDAPLTCWFYVHNYAAETFAKKRFPSEGSTSKHVIHELIIVSESGLRVTLQDRGHIGNSCHDTIVLMRNRDGAWKFSGEGSQAKLSEQDKPRNTDCWVEFGGPDAESRFGRYCPPVK